MPKGVYQRSSSQIEELRSRGFRKGSSPWNLGVPHSEETKQKLKEAWKKRPPISNETRIKLSEFHRKNPVRYWLGKKHTPEMVAARNGVNHRCWKGGITPVNMMIRRTQEYQNWRKAVYQRDNYTCQMCGARGGRILNADHIKPFSVILRENQIRTLEDARNCGELWDTQNGRTLCKPCHKQTPTFAGNMHSQLLVNS